MGRPKKTGTVTAGYATKKVQGLDGSLDVITETDELWDALLKKFSRTSRVYGFSRVETPLVEDIRLYESFHKGDPARLSRLVQAEAGSTAAALRPQLLPSVLRDYYQYKIFDRTPLNKWAYSGMTVFKDEAHKLSGDYEYGFEIFGSFSHLTEAQVIGAVWEFLLSLGLKDLVLEINNVGQDESQEAYEGTLRDYLLGKKYELCDNCSEHLQGRVLNVLRCENLDCQALLAEAPVVVDFLDPESRKHFTSILEALDELGIPYQLNPFYAGPAGHSKTNVVIKCKQKNQAEILGEGGYHDSLIQNLCGKNHRCFGFSGSLLKIKNLLAAGKVAVARDQRSDVFLVPLGELAAKKSLRLFRDLTVDKVTVYDHFGQGGVKNQLKQAENFKAPIALIMGQKEAMDEMVILRDVKSGMQEIISYDKIVEEVKKRLGK